MSAEIIDFKSYCSGCERCANSECISNGTYMCTVMQYVDGEEVITIEDGKRTSGYNVCKGQEFRLKARRKNGKRTGIR